MLLVPINSHFPTLRIAKEHALDLVLAIFNLKVVVRTVKLNKRRKKNTERERDGNPNSDDDIGDDCVGRGSGSGGAFIQRAGKEAGEGSSGAKEARDKRAAANFCSREHFRD